MNEIVNKIVDGGFDAFIVGGYVRDYLLGIKSFDIDVCTNAKIEDLIKMFKNEGIANKQYFSYHLDKGKYHYDITCFRKELEYKKNKPIKIEYAKDLKTDLLRRDFTINTFAIDSNGKLVDLLKAKKDFDNKLIRVVGDTNKRLTEDKTRIIRAIRFYSTLDFELDESIKKFLNKKGHLLNEVPREYIKKELDKIFEEGDYFKFFELVKEFKLEKYLSIKFNNIKRSYNRFGVWSQIETTLPFSNIEKKELENIKYLSTDNSLTLSNMFLYNDDEIKNAACILDYDKEINEFYKIKDMHSIIDIEVSLDTLSKYVKLKDIRRVYKILEKSILNGELENDTYSIEEFLRNRDYEI